MRGITDHFDSTLQAVDSLVAAGITVQVNTTVMRANVAELADIAALVAQTRTRIWEVFFLVHVGRGIAASSVSPDEHEDVCHFLYDASRHGFIVRTVEAPFFRRVAAARRAGSAPPQTALYDSLARRLDHLLGPPARPPSAHSAPTRDGKGIVFVAHDGEVYPAGFLPLGLGNIASQPLHEIYRSHPLLRPSAPRGSPADAAAASTPTSAADHGPAPTPPPATRSARTPPAPSRPDACPSSRPGDGRAGRGPRP